jgi:hypothetical protein
MDWLTEVQKKYNAAVAHTFLLHSNVSDVQSGTLGAVDCLLRAPLFAQRDLVLRYNRSGGIQFPFEPHKYLFCDILGITVSSSDRIDDDIALAVPRDPELALGVIERLLKTPKRETKEGVSVPVLDSSGNPVPLAGVIIDYAELLVGAGDAASLSPGDRYIVNTIMRWARELAYLGPPIVIMAENHADMHPFLKTSSSRIESVRVPLPDYEKRLAHIEALSAAAPSIGLDACRTARLTAALKLVHIEDIFLRCEVDGRPVTEAAIKQRKKEIISTEFSDVLEIIEPDENLVVGGMEYLIAMLESSVVQPINAGNIARVPMGILLAGPPGTGKTLFAGYLANATGFNCVALKQDRITDKWVGSSERNLRRAFDCFDALAPTIVVVDELDALGLSRAGGTDNGVGNRQFKMLLEYMSDPRHRGKILFLGLTNRPDLIDPALKRPGRFDRIVPVLPPEADQRAGIISAIFTRYAIDHVMSDNDIRIGGSITEHYTGADIEAVVLRSFEIAQGRGEPVALDDLKYAVSNYRLNKDRQDEYISLALKECRFIDDLPPKYRENARRQTGQRLQTLSGVPRRKRDE